MVVVEVVNYYAAVACRNSTRIQLLIGTMQHHPILTKKTVGTNQEDFEFVSVVLISILACE